MGRPGRKPQYDWEDKKDICYELYVEQGLNTPEIIQHFAKHFNLPESELPPPKHFQRRFKQWGFPARLKRLSAETEAAVVERTKELFVQNLPAWQILEKLREEGWDLDEYHLRNLRKKHGLLLRVGADGYQPGTESRKRKRTSGAVDGDGERAEENETNGASEAQPPSLPPEEAARRAQHMAEVQLQSDHLLQTRKRRRRIRGYGHLPPDAPGSEPRYKSETSLDECKAYLHLSNEQYIQIRDQYEAICREMGIIKMTLCVEGQWQASKDRLIRENMHLSSVLHPLQPDIDKRANALNIICMDVTKRIRDMGKTMTIAEANNILGLNPANSKEVRRLFYEILDADQFTTVVACGKEHLRELEDQWYAKSDILQQAVAGRDPQKIKAVNLLSKDVRKRYCDDQFKKDPRRRQWQRQKHYGPGPGPARPMSSQTLVPGKKRPKSTGENFDPQQASRTNSNATRKTIVPLGPAWDGQEYPGFRMTTPVDLVPQINFDLDPLLNETTHGPPWPPQPSGSASASQPAAQSVQAYFRLAPDSLLVGHHPKMWLGKLSAPKVEALHKAATSKAGAARVAKVHGIVKNEDSTEDRWLIESDDELGIYLEEVGEKATFSVLLDGGYA